jgi:cytochrome P450
VLDTAIILYGAGQETTANMVGNALLTLFRYPDELARLRDGAVDLDAATDELLRFDAPVHTVRRKAIADLEVDGHHIEAGQKVLCLIMAANHDPAVFDDPDGLQLDREDNYHVAFGSGVHTCLGGLLARAETRVAVGRLVERYPKMKLAVPEDEIRRSGSLVIRGVERLPLRLR